jgi:hypothetical protein
MALDFENWVNSLLKLAVAIVLVTFAPGCVWMDERQAPNVAHLAPADVSIPPKHGVAVIGLITSTIATPSGFTIRYSGGGDRRISKSFGISASDNGNTIKVLELPPGSYYMFFYGLEFGTHDLYITHGSPGFASFNISAGKISYLGDIVIDAIQVKMNQADTKDIRGYIDFSLMNNSAERSSQFREAYKLAMPWEDKLMEIGEREVQSSSIYFVTRWARFSEIKSSGPSGPVFIPVIW